jgi:hypothetical protein
MIYIKNISGSEKTFRGNVLADGAYKLIEEHDRLQWYADETIFDHISADEAQIAKLDDGSADIEDKTQQWKYLAGDLNEYDESGRSIIRTAATIKGWHYHALFFEIETSTGSIVCKDHNGTDISTTEFSYIRYDDQGDVTTTDADTVKSVVTWKPAYDYEIISGNLKQKNKAAQDLRMWVTGGVYNELSNCTPISVAPFVTNMNLSFFEETRTDGRASKYMRQTTDGVPFGTNRFQYTFEHAAGFTHKVLISVELFKE